MIILPLVKFKFQLQLQHILASIFVTPLYTGDAHLRTSLVREGLGGIFVRAVICPSFSLFLLVWCDSDLLFDWVLVSPTEFCVLTLFDFAMAFGGRAVRPPKFEKGLLTVVGKQTK